VTSRPEQPEAFIRGAAYPATEDVPYPRANPTDIARLPADVWHAASVPVGVRIELIGDAQAIDVAYRTSSGNLGYRGDGAGITFSVWRAGRKVAEEEAVLGDGLVRLDLGATAADKPAVIYLPEGMQPLVQSLTAVKGEIAPAPSLPRWIAYGDWTTQGWIASGPAQGWAAIAARKSGLNLVNMGYAGAGRGEMVSAEHIAALTAEVVTIAYGESCWSRIPHSAAMVRTGFEGFLDVVRQGHPTMPVVVISPALRPDAEEVPNKLGATLADIRDAIEAVTRDRIVSGDRALSLVPGTGIIDAGHLADGIHPGDEGHKRIAAAVAKALNAATAVAADLDRTGQENAWRPRPDPTDAPTAGRMRMTTPQPPKVRGADETGRFGESGTVGQDRASGAEVDAGTAVDAGAAVDAGEAGEAVRYVEDFDDPGAGDVEVDDGAVDDNSDASEADGMDDTRATDAMGDASDTDGIVNTGTADEVDDALEAHDPSDPVAAGRATASAH
jgi:lysophospholipase L1-like esterase